MTDGEVTYLTDLYVVPEDRGKGYGSSLLWEFLRQAKGTTVIALTDKPEFYEKFGFVRCEAMVWKGDKS